MNIEQEALEFTELLKEQYFIKRNMDFVVQVLNDNISWIGTGQGEISKNILEARQTLEREAREYGGTFYINDSRFEAQAISDSLCIVYGMVYIIPDDVFLSEENMRLSMVLQKRPEGIELLHLHMSHYDSEQEQGRCFVTKSARFDRTYQRPELSARARQLENLTKNIPGGAHRCLNNNDYTLLSMSDSFLSMFGYTSEEIEEQFGNKFINMIYEHDREEMQRSIHYQLLNSYDIEVEYRVVCKDKSLVWVLDKGRLYGDENGNECFYCILIEISERKRQEEELRLLLERYQVIMNQTTDIIFEWDINRDRIQFSSNWKKKFGYEPIRLNISKYIPLSNNIHKKDMHNFVKIMKDMVSGVSYSETEFRIKNIEGKYLWCRIRATAQYDNDKKPIKAVGVIIDIDLEKKQRQELMDQAQHDALTGLYNKAAINTLVKQRMQANLDSSGQVMMIIDVDHFKVVNDTYGHLCGDSVLSDVSAALKSHSDIQSLVGRIGGDEFLVYLPEIRNRQEAEERAQDIWVSLQQLRPEAGAASISCSIGVAFFPRGSIDYYDLYKCADQALYYQKNNGRGGVSFFDSNTCNKKISYGAVPSAVNELISSDENNVVDEQLAQYAFRMLYETLDVEHAINKILEIVGQYYGVSRVYIFESSEDGLSGSITFEWCDDGIAPQMGVHKNIPYECDLGDYKKNFKPDGVFCCFDVEKASPGLNKVLQSKGICSMLQCAMIDEGKFVGGIGFDECCEKKIWSRDQISSFRLTSNVISTFLMKLRLKQRLDRY